VTAAKAPPLRRATLIGAGRMGAAMARGWLRDLKVAGLTQLYIAEPQPDDDIVAWSKDGKVVLNGAAAPADVVVLAVKPQGFGEAAGGLTGWIGPNTLVISIMAGVTIKRIASALCAPKVVRAMPNTPGAIGKGVTAYSLSTACDAGDRAAAERLLRPLGEVVGPLDETQMDAVTAVSGSGPAYVFLFAETLEAAGRAAGLDPATAAILARQTVFGAGALLGRGGDPTDLRKAVTSPGGTTAAALDVFLSKGALPDLVRKAVEAAARRGAELARDADK
jgi:pyrroline-5-carboxylate reductase